LKSKNNPKTGSSENERSPLKSIKWVFRPKKPKPIINPVRGRIKPVERGLSFGRIRSHKKLFGQMRESGVIHLAFDVGLLNEIEAIARTLKDRRNQTVTKPQKFGWGGQLSFDYYLNFFAEYSKFTFKSDRCLGTRYPKPYDFLIKFMDGTSFKVEIKTAPYLSRRLSYFKRREQSYPDYVVCVVSLNEEMTKYELYGWALGIEIKKHKSTIRYGKKCHRIPINRANFNYYSFFHKKILRLPYLEKFSDS